MKIDDLVSELQEAQKLKEEKDKELKDLEKRKNEKEDFIKNSIMFSPNELSKVLTLLLFAREQKVYIPVNGYYFSVGNVYNFYVLTPSDIITSCDDNRKIVQDKNTVILYLNNCSMMYPDYDRPMTTYKFILDEYGIEIDKPEYITEYYFEGHEYIKDFIRYLIELNIENKNKRLNDKELYQALNDFINQQNIELKESKPNTRILNKKD